MKKIILLLLISSQSLFSQNTTTVNTKVNVMGMDVMNVQVQETTTTTQTQTETPKNNNVSNQDNSNTCSIPVSSNEYGKITSSVKSQSFEETQLKIAKQAIKANCMSAAQIKGICKLFSFEESKLEFAIFAHTYCTDKNNYYTINDVFSYSASVDSLTDAIENK